MGSASDELAAGLCVGSTISQLAGSVLSTVYAWVSVAAVIITALLLCMNHVLRRVSKPFTALDLKQRVVTTFHASYVLLYAGCAIPMTYYGIRIVWLPAGDDLALIQRFRSDFVPAFILVNLQSVAYIAEAGSRTMVKTNWVLLLHHCVFHTILIVGFLKLDILTLKHGLILNTFAMYEIGLFATLAARRLALPHKLIVTTWWLGMILYPLTRLLQTGVLVWLFVVSYSEMAGCGQSGLWWGNLVLFSVISVVQIYTFPLYLGVLRRSVTAAKRTVQRVGTSLRRMGTATMRRLNTTARAQREADLAEIVASLPAVEEEAEGDGEGGGKGGEGGSDGSKGSKLEPAASTLEPSRQ